MASKWRQESEQIKITGVKMIKRPYKTCEEALKTWVRM